MVVCCENCCPYLHLRVTIGDPIALLCFEFEPRLPRLLLLYYYFRLLVKVAWQTAMAIAITLVQLVELEVFKAMGVASPETPLEAIVEVLGAAWQSIREGC